MKKHTLAAVAVWTLFGVASIDLAQAQDDHGDTRETATILSLGPVLKTERQYWLATSGITFKGEIEQSGDVDYFIFRLNEPATFAMQGPDNPGVGFRLENSEGRPIESRYDDNRDGIDYVQAELSVGRYYVRVHDRDISLLRRRGAPVEDSGGYEMSGEIIFAGNDDHSDIMHFETATSVRVNSSERGIIQSDDPGDSFQIAIDRPGRLTIYSTGETDVRGHIASYNGWTSEDGDLNGNFGCGGA